MDLLAVVIEVCVLIGVICWINSNKIWRRGICPTCLQLRELDHIAVDLEMQPTYYWVCKCPVICTTGKWRFKQYCKTFNKDFSGKKIKGVVFGTFLEDFEEFNERNITKVARNSLHLDNLGAHSSNLPANVQNLI